jgi:arylsulfatase A-like enzyme
MNMRRREFIQAAGAVSSGALLPSRLFGRAASVKRPNILIIMVDQMNLDAISAYRDVLTDPAFGAPSLETPNLDRMIRNGVSFIESHSADPICCPARGCFWTGRMSCETGLFYNNIGIDRNLPNMGQWFEQHSDYRRIYCGKWHAGGRWNCPTVDGPRKIPGFETLPVGDQGNGHVMDYQVSTAVEAVVRNWNEESPFLLVAGLLDPHDCCFWSPNLGKDLITSGSDYFDLEERLPPLPPNQNVGFSDAGISGGWIASSKWGELHWKNYIYDYLRQVERLDKQVGRMLKAVEQRDEDTLVIFTSDHGDGTGRHRRIGKWYPYEHSMKIPLIFYSPKRPLQRGLIDRQRLVSHVDVLPTVCDYAGITPPPDMRGTSLRPLLEGTHPDDWRDHVYSSFNYTGRMIRSQRYKYVMRYEFSGQVSKKPGDGVVDLPFVRKDNGKPSRFIPGRGDLFKRVPKELLFDLQADPWERQDLADLPAYASVMKEHRELLAQWEEKLTIGTRYDRN